MEEIKSPYSRFSTFKIVLLAYCYSRKTVQPNMTACDITLGIASPFFFCFLYLMVFVAQAQKSVSETLELPNHNILRKPY